MDNQSPVLIKRKKVVAGGGHHGGAWKVAYADFVTAMMAFFMLMWLLNATTEKQRTGIADYFNPTISINKSKESGNGPLYGDTVLGTNITSASSSSENVNPSQLGEFELFMSSLESQRSLKELELEINSKLYGNSGENILQENQLRHIVTRITDEGVSIEIFSIEGRAIFDENESPTDILVSILSKLVITLGSVDNKLAVVGHVKSRPFAVSSGNPWEVSVSRAVSVNNLLRLLGVQSQRVRRVVGKSNTDLAILDPLSVRNDRIELILLR